MEREGKRSVKEDAVVVTYSQTVVAFPETGKSERIGF